MLAELIAEKVDPEVICHYIGVCQDSIAEKSTITTNPTDVQTPYNCIICQSIFHQMIRFPTLKSEQDDLLVMLKKSCNLFSAAKLKQECQDYLDHNRVDFSRVNSEPKLVCQDLKICSKIDQESTVTTTSMSVSSSVRHDRCIFGMNYWCISHQTAELCHVRRNV